MKYCALLLSLAMLPAFTGCAGPTKEVVVVPERTVVYQPIATKVIEEKVAKENHSPAKAKKKHTGKAKGKGKKPHKGGGKHKKHKKVGFKKRHALNWVDGSLLLA